MFPIFFNFAIAASDYHIIVFNKILKIQALLTDCSIDPSVQMVLARSVEGWPLAIYRNLSVTSSLRNPILKTTIVASVTFHLSYVSFIVFQLRRTDEGQQARNSSLRLLSSLSANHAGFGRP